MFSELYLRARRELRTSWDGIGDISLAVELFRQALLRSPDDPAALSGFAMARSRRYNYDGGNDEKLTEIRAVAERAVALAPHMGEPLLTLASLDYVTSEWPRAVRALRGALRLAPGLLKAHETLGYIEVEVGRLREGGLRLQNVHALDPAQPLVRHELARVGASRATGSALTSCCRSPPKRTPESRSTRSGAPGSIYGLASQGSTLSRPKMPPGSQRCCSLGRWGRPREADRWRRTSSNSSWG